MVRPLLLTACAVLAASCATSKADSAYPEAGGNYPSDAGTSSGCHSNYDCPVSYTCEQGVCKPPEVEPERPANQRPPVAGPRYVYALNPSADALARIDPATLAIESIPVGPSPVDFASIGGKDSVAVLSEGDASITLVDSSTTPSRVTRVQLKRAFTRLAVSPDGAFAIAYPDPSSAPPQGAEGVLSLVDIHAAFEGAPASAVLFERAVGYRVTDVIFRVESGAATRAFVVTKDTISIVELKQPAAHPLPARVALPASMSAAIDAREVVATDDGAHLVLRSTTAAELAYFDGATLRTVPIAEVATDLDLLPDGTAAVAALRAAKKLAFIRIPADLVDPTGILTLDLGDVPVGQVVLPRTPPASGNFALVYTNASAEESFARVDLPAGTVTVYPLQKWVSQIALSPDGSSAIIVHRPNPNSHAQDEYEQQVDADQGYTVFDVKTGYMQLRRTGAAAPGPFAFAPSGAYVGMALREDTKRSYAVDAVDLASLICNTLTLASPPLFVGPVPQAQGTSPDRVFISQDHPVGRISVIDLALGQIRTATGFTLNSEIE